MRVVVISSWDVAATGAWHPGCSFCELIWRWDVEELAQSAIVVTATLICSSVCALDVLGHRAVGALGVFVEAALTFVGLGHGFENALAAHLGAHRPRSGFPVSEDVLAVHATVRVPVLHQVGRVDPESPQFRWRCSLS